MPAQLQPVPVRAQAQAQVRAQVRAHARRLDLDGASDLDFNGLGIILLDRRAERRGDLRCAGCHQQVSC